MEIVFAAIVIQALWCAFREMPIEKSKESNAKHV